MFFLFFLCVKAANQILLEQQKEHISFIWRQESVPETRFGKFLTQSITHWRCDPQIATIIATKSGTTYISMHDDHALISYFWLIQKLYHVAQWPQIVNVVKVSKFYKHMQ
jgi:NRPS condensation-like uncharacterized protein